MTKYNPNTNEIICFTDTEPKKIYNEIKKQKSTESILYPEFIIIAKPNSLVAEIYHVYTQRYFTSHYPKISLSRESMKLMGWL